MGEQFAFERVREFLREHGPSRAKVILARTGVSRSNLSQIIFKTHRRSFVSSPLTGYTRTKLWALASEVDPNLAQFTVTIPQEALAKIQAIADEIGITEAEVVTRLLDRCLSG